MPTMIILVAGFAGFIRLRRFAWFMRLRWFTRFIGLGRLRWFRWLGRFVMVMMVRIRIFTVVAVTAIHSGCTRRYHKSESGSHKPHRNPSLYSLKHVFHTFAFYFVILTFPFIKSLIYYPLPNTSSTS